MVAAVTFFNSLFLFFCLFLCLFLCLFQFVAVAVFFGGRGEEGGRGGGGEYFTKYLVN